MHERIRDKILETWGRLVASHPIITLMVCVAVVALMAAALLLTIRVYDFKPLVGLVLLPLMLGVALLPRWDPRLLFIGILRERVARPNVYQGIESFLEIYKHQFAPAVVFHDDDPTIDDYNAFREQFGREEMIIIAVTPENV